MRLLRIFVVAFAVPWIAACRSQREDGRAICEADIAASNASAESPVWTLRRLTQYELSRTFDSLIGHVPRALSRLPQEDGDASSTAPSSFEVDLYREIADEAADSSAKSLLESWRCGSNLGCVQREVLNFLERAYRAPLEPIEREGYSRFFASTEHLQLKLRGVLEIVFQSPRFLYLIESGTASEGRVDARELTGWELATRLAYFLWSEPPDDVLREAAARGDLRATTTLREQARRMVQDSRAARAIGHVLQEWAAPELNIVAKADAVYPEFDPKLRAAMLEQFDQFAAMALRENSDLGTLLSTARAPVNARLAQLLDAPVPDSLRAGWKVVELPAPRFGFLTLPGVLTANARADDSSPVQRGLFMRQNLLCQTMPPPPQGVPPLPPATGSGTSFRERFDAHTAHPVCATCHSRMDPLGFPFEIYDGLGRLRENPETIDTAGALVGVHAPAEFADLRALVGLLLESQELPQCWTQLWMQRAPGFDGSRDEVLLTELTGKVRAGLSLRDLLVEIVVAPEFRRVRPPSD